MKRNLDNSSATRSNQAEPTMTMTSANSASTCHLPCLEISASLDNDKVNESKLDDPFAEQFGVKNKFGETMLYEAPAEIVRIAIFAYPNYDESCELIGPGKISVIFYPNIEEIRLILQPESHLWPVRNEPIEAKQQFDYDCWLWRDNGKNRMCRRREDLAPFERAKGFVFGDWSYYGVAFSSEDEVAQLKNVIRCIQTRLANDRVPKLDNLRDSFGLKVSSFWCCTGLRASNLKIVCLHIGSVWRINEKYSVEHDRKGMVALATKTENPEALEMLVIFRTRNGDEVEDVRKCYRVPASLGFVASHITPENKKDSVWEWAIDGDLWACACRPSEESKSFKEMVDSYVGELKKLSKKLFGRK